MKNLGVGSWPTRKARSQRQHPAITDAGVTWTFGEVDTDTTRLARALQRRGVVKGDRVAYLGLNSYDFLAVLFATAKLGAVFVPLNTRLAPPEVEYILRDSQPTIFFWDTPFDDIVEKLRSSELDVECIPVQDAEDSVSLTDLRHDSQGDKSVIDEPVEHEDLFMIQYTSGTSGYPKGVMISHGNITWNTMNTLVDMNFTSRTVSLVMAPMFHSASLNMLVLPTFIKGAHSIVEPSFNPGRALDLIERWGVTDFFGVASMYIELMQHENWATADISTLKQFATGGQAMPESMLRTLEDLGIAVETGYGLTEASPALTILRGSDAFEKLGTAGGPHFFTEVKVIDFDGNEVSPGEVGEIIARGPNVMSGYFQNETATAATFTADGWLRTGDLGSFDGDGYLTIVDRVKDMIISGGENIYPAEVEQAIYNHPGVLEAAVVGIPDERWGEAGLAVVSVRPGETLTEEELLAFLETQIARYKVPKTVVFRDSLPHTASGKILKRELREALSDSTGA